MPMLLSGRDGPTRSGSDLRSNTRVSSAIALLERAVGAIALLALVTWLLSAMSAHVFAGNSDGATVVLEGQSINSGNLLLHGWGLSNDSFWSVDAMFYALFVHVEGVTKTALHVVPALIVGIIALLGLWMVRDEVRSWRFVLSGSVVCLVLALPSPNLSFFLLQGPWHVGTTLYCLVAFAALANGRWNVGFVVAVVALVAGFLGDLATLTFGMIPAIFAGLSEMVRMRSLRRGLPSIAAGLGAFVLAKIGRAALNHAGAFTLASGITHATSNRYMTNIGHSMSWLSGLLGVTRLAIGPASTVSADAVTNGSGLSRLVHLPLACIVAGGVAYSLFVFVRGLIIGDKGNRRSERSLRLDALLLSGAAGSIATFVYLCPNDNADYARYLTAALIFGTILSARTVARTLRRVDRPRPILASALGAVALIALIGVATAGNLSRTSARQPSAVVTDFLAHHHLTIGIGDYWSASIVTVSSGEGVIVRPVITDPAGRIVRYGRQSDASWYARARFEFLIYDVKHPWRHINATTAITTFGRPKVAYVVGSYRIIVWPKPLLVSTVGFTRG